MLKFTINTLFNLKLINLQSIYKKYHIKQESSQTGKEGNICKEHFPTF